MYMYMFVYLKERVKEKSETRKEGNNKCIKGGQGRPKKVTLE